MSKPSHFRLILRVYAATEDLNVANVKQLLKLDENGPKISEYSDDPAEGVAFVFDNSPFVEGEKLPYPAFFRAVLWLRARQIEQFEEIRKSGWKADVALSSYMGMVPQALLEEILRLNLSLWVFP